MPATKPKRIQFTLTAQLPSGKNRILFTRKGHRYPGERFVAWRSEAEREVLRQVRGDAKPLRGRLRLFVIYRPQDRRVRDVSGLLDALFHLFARCGLIEDDGQIREVRWSEVGGRCPATLVELEEAP